MEHFPSPITIKRNQQLSNTKDHGRPTATGVFSTAGVVMVLCKDVLVILQRPRKSCFYHYHIALSKSVHIDDFKSNEPTPWAMDKTSSDKTASCRFGVGDLLTKYLFGNFGNVAISGPASAPQECGVQPPFM
jgi:hypothetical protein